MMLGWLAGIAVTWSGAAALWVAPTAALTTIAVALGLTRTVFRAAAMPTAARSATSSPATGAEQAY
jgi:hypothetical protein